MDRGEETLLVWFSQAPLAEIPVRCGPVALFFLFFKEFIIYLLVYLFIHSFIHSLAALGLRCCVWAFSSCGKQGLLFVALHGLLLLQSTGSRRVGFSSCGSRALERRLSSCGTRASLLRGMWNLPRPGLEPVSPALAGGFLTTAPPGKARASDFRSLTLGMAFLQQLSFLSLGWPFSCMVGYIGRMLKTGSQSGFSEVKGLCVWLVFSGTLVLLSPI